MGGFSGHRSSLPLGSPESHTTVLLSNARKAKPKQCCDPRVARKRVSYSGLVFGHTFGTPSSMFSWPMVVLGHATCPSRFLSYLLRKSAARGMKQIPSSRLAVDGYTVHIATSSLRPRSSRHAEITFKSGSSRISQSTKNAAHGGQRKN